MLNASDIYSEKLSTLSIKETSIINETIEKLGHLAGYELSEKSHLEDPWIKARRNIPLGKPCSNIVLKKSIQDFFIKNPI
ncbi:MAG: type II toxin-antitoxin system antitoxin SocA domain-containing protein [Alphaproteobacteria bacterium]